MPNTNVAHTRGLRSMGGTVVQAKDAHESGGAGVASIGGPDGIDEWGNDADTLTIVGGRARHEGSREPTCWI